MLALLWLMTACFVVNVAGLSTAVPTSIECKHLCCPDQETLFGIFVHEAVRSGRRPEGRQLDHQVNASSISLVQQNATLVSSQTITKNFTECRNSCFKADNCTLLAVTALPSSSFRCDFFNSTTTIISVTGGVKLFSFRDTLPILTFPLPKRANHHKFIKSASNPDFNSTLTALIHNLTALISNTSTTQTKSHWQAVNFYKALVRVQLDAKLLNSTANVLAPAKDDKRELVVLQIRFGHAMNLLKQKALRKAAPQKSGLNFKSPASPAKNKGGVTAQSSSPVARSPVDPGKNRGGNAAWQVGNPIKSSATRGVSPTRSAKASINEKIAVKKQKVGSVFTTTTKTTIKATPNLFVKQAFKARQATRKHGHIRASKTVKGSNGAPSSLAAKKASTARRTWGEHKHVRASETVKGFIGAKSTLFAKKSSNVRQARRRHGRVRASKTAKSNKAKSTLSAKQASALRRARRRHRHNRASKTFKASAKATSGVSAKKATPLRKPGAIKDFKASIKTTATPKKKVGAKKTSTRARSRTTKSSRTLALTKTLGTKKSTTRPRSKATTATRPTKKSLSTTKSTTRTRSKTTKTSIKATTNTRSARKIKPTTAKGGIAPRPRTSTTKTQKKAVVKTTKSSAKPTQPSASKPKAINRQNLPKKVVVKSTNGSAKPAPSSAPRPKSKMSGKKFKRDLSASQENVSENGLTEAQNPPFDKKAYFVVISNDPLASYVMDIIPTTLSDIGSSSQISTRAISTSLGASSVASTIDTGNRIVQSSTTDKSTTPTSSTTTQSSSTIKATTSTISKTSATTQSSSAVKSITITSKTSATTQSSSTVKPDAQPVIHIRVKSQSPPAISSTTTTATTMTTTTTTTTTKTTTTTTTTKATTSTTTTTNQAIHSHVSSDTGPAFDPDTIESSADSPNLIGQSNWNDPRPPAPQPQPMVPSQPDTPVAVPDDGSQTGLSDSFSDPMSDTPQGGTLDGTMSTDMASARSLSGVNGVSADVASARSLSGVSGVQGVSNAKPNE